MVIAAVAATAVVLVVDFGGDFAVDTMTVAHLDTWLIEYADYQTDFRPFDSESKPLAAVNSLFEYESVDYSPLAAVILVESFAVETFADHNFDLDLDRDDARVAVKVVVADVGIVAHSVTDDDYFERDSYF